MIRKAEIKDIEDIHRLLIQVNMVHHNARPDLFNGPSCKYTNKELEDIINDQNRPIFVYEIDSKVYGYAFCVKKQFVNDNIMTDIKTFYIDDLCVDETKRGHHIGLDLYNYVIEYAKENDFYNLTLNVWYDNTSALNFYKKIGLKIQKIGMEKILK